MQKKSLAVKSVIFFKKMQPLFLKFEKTTGKNIWIFNITKNFK